MFIINSITMKITLFAFLISAMPIFLFGQTEDSIAWDKVFYSISKKRHIAETPIDESNISFGCKYSYVFRISSVDTILSSKKFPELNIALVDVEDLFFCGTTTYNNVLSIIIDKDRIQITIYVIENNTIQKKYLFVINRKNYKTKKKKIKD